MKKNYKFLSSLALTGVLATGIMGTTFASTTKTVGIYQNLVNGKNNVVPFVLADMEDRVTIQDIMDSGKFDSIQKFKGNAVSNPDAVVSTGDTFVANGGKEYTAVVYGDLSKDGQIDIDDVVLAERTAVGKLNPELEGIAKKAGDLRNNDNEIDVDDVVALKRFAVGKSTELVNPLPEKEPEESSSYNCDITVNENSYINSENVEHTKIGVKLSQTYEKLTTLTVKVLDENKEEITVNGLSGTITINPHTDYQAIENIDFSNVSANKVIIQLLDEKGTIAGTTTVEINTVRPQAALISTERTSTTDATMSLSAQGDSTLVKMYYVVLDSTKNAPVWDASKSEFKEEKTKSVNIQNNKLENAVISNELKPTETYKVYYVLENSYGSRSQEPQVADILSDTVNSQIAKIGTINVPDLSKNETEFTWEAPENATGYIVTVYKDGNIIFEETCSSSKYDIGNKIQEEGAGKYKISVIAKGDGTTSKNSEATQSGEVEVKALKTVSNIAFEMNTEGKAMLSWTDSNEKNDVKEYQIHLYPLKENGKFTDTPVTVTAKETKTEITINPNVVYKAEVMAIAQDDQVKLVNAEASTLEGFYKIEAHASLDATKITENSANLTLEDVKVNGKSATYQVKVYLVNEDNNPEKPLYTLVATKNVAYKDGEIVIDGLESNKGYAFKLIANVDGIQGESNYITGAHTLNKTPEIKNLKVVKDEKEAKTGTIYKNGDTLIINGEKFEVTANSNYSEDFKAIVKVIATLHANDIVTIEGETITLKLPSEASDSSQALDLGIAAKDMNVVIEGNGFEKRITATQGSEPKEVTCKGTNARFDVSGLNAKKIMLTNGVTVTGNQEYTLVAGTSVVINGVRVTTQKETTINANGKELNVTANKEANNLVFENLNAANIDGTEAIIKFIGEPDLTSKQLGTITIKTEGGKVTVAQQNVNVSSTLNVEVNAGEVIVNDVALTGNKNITVTNKEEGTAIVEAIAKIKAPVAMTNIELKDYTEEEFKTTFPEVTKAEDKEAVRNYINSFGINGKGANIDVAKDSNEVKITFTKVVTDLTISGIK